MIVRILNEGQWEIDPSAVGDLNHLDDLIEQAVKVSDADQLQQALSRLLDEVRSAGTPVPDDDLRDSDLILPAADSTLDDVRSLLTESGEGLIPN